MNKNEKYSHCSTTSKHSTVVKEEARSLLVNTQTNVTTSTINKGLTLLAFLGAMNAPTTLALT